jgi:membrane-associated phospholipid phosphatase
MATNTITGTVAQNQSTRQEDTSGLHSPGLFAKWPIIGLIMFIFGGLAFGALTYNLLAQGPLLQWDRELANTLPPIALKSPPIIKDIMVITFYIGTIMVDVIDILLSLYFIFKRYWQELTMVVIGGLGGGLLFYTLSAYFARPRPPNQIWVIVNLPGFPSGHAIASVVCYGLIAYLLAPKMSSAFWKGVVIAAALFIIGLIGFSRIFTAGHYLTDVLSGYAVGIAWMGVIYTLIELYFQKRRSRNV